jgi:hypothetical protein
MIIRLGPNDVTWLYNMAADVYWLDDVLLGQRFTQMSEAWSSTDKFDATPRANSQPLVMAISETGRVYRWGNACSWEKELPAVSGFSFTFTFTKIVLLFFLLKLASTTCIINAIDEQENCFCFSWRIYQ